MAGMADHVHLTLELGTDGDEPVGSLDHPGTGRSRRFWGWLELIEAAPEAPGATGAGSAERAHRLVTVGPQFEGEMHVIRHTCHVSQPHATRPTVASGNPA